MTPKARSRVRDAEATQRRLLEAADRLFARGGYEGTSLRDLVAETGVNKRMIYHYFGDKAGLYRRLFLNHWADLKAAFDAELARVRGPEALSPLLLLVFRFMAGRPSFVRLLMWEGLEGGAISRSLWKDIRGPLFHQVEASVRAAQKAGRLDPELDPGALVVSFLGAVTFYFGYANSLGDLLGERNPLSPDALTRYGEHLGRLAEALMRN